MTVRKRSTVPASGFGASDMQRIGHHYRPPVDCIPWRKARDNNGAAAVVPASSLRRTVTMLKSDRRDFLRLTGLAGVAFTAGLFPNGRAQAQANDFHFVQFSDTHWGYS